MFCHMKPSKEYICDRNRRPRRHGGLLPLFKTDFHFANLRFMQARDRSANYDCLGEEELRNRAQTRDTSN